MVFNSRSSGYVGLSVTYSIEPFHEYLVSFTDINHINLSGQSIVLITRGS